MYSFSPNFFTSSPALASCNQNIFVNPIPERKKSRLCRSLAVPFTREKPSTLALQSPSFKTPRLEKRLYVDQTVDMPYFRQMIHAYSEYLLTLGLYEKRSQLLYSIGISFERAPMKRLILEVVSECTCLVKVPSCKKCKHQRLKCTFCRLPSRGISIFCLKCFHGGHLKCMKEAFGENGKHTECLSGCGCECVFSIEQ